MVGKARYSDWLMRNPEAKNPSALERITLAKKRVLSILDREVVAHQKTLEQKIADQGPRDQRVDPHLIGLALKDMIELRRVQKREHPESGTRSWYANIGTPQNKIEKKLNDLGPLYASVNGGGFGNLAGDALEIITFKCIKAQCDEIGRLSYHGHFFLERAKKNGRYEKMQPPKHIGGHSTKKEADFLLYGYDEGVICVECKNIREWLYPRDTLIKELIIKSYELNTLPLLVARRIHYTTKTNLFIDAGIMAHESYYQYYPSDHKALADRVRHKKSLGFTDVTASEDPHPRTIKFFSEDLPKIIPAMSRKWNENRQALYEFALGEMNLSQLYTAIGSRVGGKWVDEPEEYYDYELPEDDQW